MVDESLVTLLAGGHALLVGVPGLAKTRLVETLGQVLGLNERRVQFTPDLMPADIIGSEVTSITPHTWLYIFFRQPLCVSSLVYARLERRQYAPKRKEAFS